MIRWALLAVLGWSADALACGGPEYYDLYQLSRPADSFANEWLYPFDGYESGLHEQVRFLGPLYRENAAAYQGLWDRFYPTYGEEEGKRVDQPTAAGSFDAALAKGDLAALEAAALAVVSETLDQPAVLAPETDEELARAVEFLELKGALLAAKPEQVQAYFSGKGPVHPTLNALLAARFADAEASAKLVAKNPKHPRMATLRLRMLRHQFQTQIPDGWDAYEIQERMGADVPAKLNQEIDRWLASFPTHPMADYVRLYKVRIAYLSGNDAEAWRILVEEFPKHPVRIAGEMRFLVTLGRMPEGVDLNTADRRLAPVLVRYLTLDETQWNHWWKEASAHTDQPWAVELQRQLLIYVAEGKGSFSALPAEFPLAASAPDPDWSTARMLGLMRFDRSDLAWEQAQLGGNGPMAPIRSRLMLQRGDWVGAICEPGIDEGARSYLIRVIASDTVLKELAAKAPEAIRETAVQTIAYRQAAKGDWKGAAKKLGEPWKEVASEAKKQKSDPLRWARYLQAHRGELFMGNDRVFIRSMNEDLGEDSEKAEGGLPWTLGQQEQSQTAWLKTSFEDYYALSTYAKLFDATSEEELRRDPVHWIQIIQEADQSYNKLLNYGNGEYIWASVIRDSDQAKSVRRAGKIVRQELNK